MYVNSQLNVFYFTNFSTLRCKKNKKIKDVKKIYFACEKCRKVKKKLVEQELLNE